MVGLDCNYLPSDVASDTEQGLLDSATVGFFINSLVNAGLSMSGHFIKPKPSTGSDIATS